MITIANNNPPTEDIINLKNQGKSNEEIIGDLSQKGFNNQQISEGINQADIKLGVEGKVPAENNENAAPPEEGMQASVLPGESMGSEIPIPVPPPVTAIATEEDPQFAQPTFQKLETNSPQPSMDIESVQEIVESIIDERWQEVVASVGDISIWKSRVEDDVVSIKQEILRLNDKLNKLHLSIIGKVDEYQKGITKVSSEMEALEKVFSKIMEPLTTNIKELQRITQKIKKKE